MDLLPTQGWGTWQHMVLPVVAYCLAPLGLVARFTRVSMLEAMAAGQAPMAQKISDPKAAVPMAKRLPSSWSIITATDRGSTARMRRSNSGL